MWFQHRLVYMNWIRCVQQNAIARGVRLRMYARLDCYLFIKQAKRVGFWGRFNPLANVWLNYIIERGVNDNLFVVLQELLGLDYWEKLKSTVKEIPLTFINSKYV